MLEFLVDVVDARDAAAFAQPILPRFHKLFIFLHVLGVAAWVGGSAMLAVAVVTLVRDPQLKDHLPRLVGTLGRRASVLGWLGLILLVISGVMLLLIRGGGSLLSVNLWLAGGWTVALLHKLAFVVIILGLAAWHDFYAGPKAIALWTEKPDAPETARARKISSWVGRGNLTLSLIVVYLGVVLSRGCA